MAVGMLRGDGQAGLNLDPTPEAELGRRYPVFSEHTSRDPDPAYRHAIVSLTTSGNELDHPLTNSVVSISNPIL